jgi:hypothetical protein
VTESADFRHSNPRFGIGLEYRFFVCIATRAHRIGEEIVSGCVDREPATPCNKDTALQDGGVGARRPSPMSTNGAHANGWVKKV